MSEPEGPPPSAGPYPPAELKNRLDAALDRLEEVVKARIEQPMRNLREVIAKRRLLGEFDEERLATEIEALSHRERMESRRGFQIGEEIVSLTNRIAALGFP